MADPVVTPPEIDEIEVSLFGPGYGESIAVHLSDKKWLIVDSCRRNRRAEPAALEYLRRIGVDVSTQVAVVVATHWHDDHVRGLAEVYRACISAVFVCSMSLKSTEFINLVSAKLDGESYTSSGVSELQEIMTEVAERRVAAPQNEHNRFAVADSCVWAHPGGSARIYTLSPSSTAIIRSMNEIAKMVPEVERLRLRVPAPQPNHTSLVLWISTPRASLLLGGDLEITADPTDGWEAIVQSTTRPKERAGVYKVAHHGSKTGHHEGVYSELLTPESLAILTPWRRGRQSLPTLSDQKRICSRVGSAFLTATPANSTAQRRNPAVERTVREMGARITRIDPVMGHVQLRLAAGSPNWVVRLSSSASELCA